MGAFHCVAAQELEQLLTVPVVPDADGADLVEHAQALQLRLAGFQLRRVLDQVDLIDDRNGGAAPAQRVDQHLLRLIDAGVRLEQHHGHIHVAQRIAGGLVHPLAQLVFCLVDAGRVQQDILQRPPGNDAGDPGAGGLRFGGDNGHLFPHQQVGQAGFAHVGPADDRHEHRRSIIAGGVVFLVVIQGSVLAFFFYSV